MLFYEAFCLFDFALLGKKQSCKRLYWSVGRKMTVCKLAEYGTFIVAAGELVEVQVNNKEAPLLLKHV